ncbi:trp operon repressor [Mannheimia haemolytica]|uniref:trp operon repressor n=1 Tax=Mannheimia haemolytica TaxID=75985 RepID=UPI002EBD9AFD|nr:trp operon repressor [Mannheimia haemolytica]
MKTLYNRRDPNEWTQFLALLEQAVAEDKLEPFFSMFLTADERGSLGLRLQIVQALLKGEDSQREIQQNLNTSAATITRGSNMLKILDQDFLQWVNGKVNGTVNGKA